MNTIFRTISKLRSLTSRLERLDIRIDADEHLSTSEVLGTFIQCYEAMKALEEVWPLLGRLAGITALEAGDESVNQTLEGYRAARLSDVRVLYGTRAVEAARPKSVRKLKGGR
jgi:hypothetical protein